MDSFYSRWKQASFGWIPKKHYFDLKILAFFSAYALVLQYQNSNHIFFVMFKLAGFTVLWQLFKKWFAERITFKDVLDEMKINLRLDDLDAILQKPPSKQKVLAAELDNWDNKEEKNGTKSKEF